ncbi:hypothetical protein J3R82DRAFT_2266, partial [Butyriboletus roseoflavus]
SVAMIQPYSAPHHELLTLSSQTVASCTLLAEGEVVVVNIKHICSIVTMVP